MSVESIDTNKKFDYQDTPTKSNCEQAAWYQEYRQHTAGTVLELGSLAMRFSRVERVPRYEDGRRESDVEHSFMLSLVASELAYQLYPDELDVRQVTQYALVHDLIEVKTGDTATFLFSQADCHEKEVLEQAALASLLEELPPYIGNLVYDYEQQAGREARFVRAVDKLLPLAVDILGSGRRVMAEDYDVHTTAELTACHDKLHRRIAHTFSEFPEIITSHQLLCELFKLEFDTSSSEASQVCQ